MNYLNTKLGMAMTMRKHISEETFEQEYDGSSIKLMNHLIWGDKDLFKKQLLALEQNEKLDS